MTIKGILIPIGGNEDKGLGKDENYTLDFIQEGILSRVVREAGSVDAPIVIIPTASQIPDKVGKNYIQAFQKLGCTRINVLNIRTKKEANAAVNLRLLEEAGIIMFSGGDQSRITRIIGESEMKAILVRKYHEEPVVIAGTSAGAMAMSDEMIAGGKSTEAMFKGGIRMGKGLGLIPGLIIDSHFIQRGRFNRIAEATAMHPQLLGVGLAEDTGIIIRHGNDCQVIGSGMVIFFDPSHLTHNNAAVLPEGTPMSMANLTVHILANSDHFRISDRKITVLPVDAPWE
ncbi:MAG: cyanophycinase [Saprospiraceae bacterium]|nr:cyanophycinase [Saprospiraceae bacterium]